MVERLRHALGEEAAETLMSAYLPPGGWGEVATKADLAELRAEMGALRADIQGQLVDVRATVVRENRTLLFGLIGVFTAYGAALVAAVRLH